MNAMIRPALCSRTYVFVAPVDLQGVASCVRLGPLLRVTDVERQPFRSMGFVCVIIVSGIFALGLPLVLL